jgi:predicted porin
MKKTQVAVAALAMLASSAVLADVAVKGCVDAAIVSTDAGTVLGGAGDGCASQMGFYASEEIGDMKASINLETGFSTGNGAINNGGNTSATGVFNRLANVGLGTKAATVTLGVAKSAWIEAAGGGLTAYGMNGIGVPALAILNGNLSGTSQTGGFFVGNIVGLSGDLGTFSYNIQSTVNDAGSATTYAAAANNAQTTTIAGTSDSYTAVRLSAPAGAATLNFGYENRKNTPATALTGGNIDYTNWVASASLPLDGGFSVNAAYAKQSIGTGQTNTTYTAGNNVAAEQTGYILGAAYKMSDAVGFGVTYAKNNNQTDMFGASAQYNFSATTVGYANYADFSNAVQLNNGGTAQSFAAGTTTTYTGKVLSIGIHHAF